MKNELDLILKKHYRKTLDSNGFKLLDSLSSGMAIIYYFKNDTLNFSIANDRGVIETRLSSIYSKEEYDFDILNAFFYNIKQNQNNKIKFCESDLSKRLPLKQEAYLFESNIKLIESIFSKDKWKETEFELKKFQKERGKLLFG